MIFGILDSLLDLVGLGGKKRRRRRRRVPMASRRVFRVSGFRRRQNGFGPRRFSRVGAYLGRWRRGYVGRAFARRPRFSRRRRWR